MTDRTGSGDRGPTATLCRELATLARRPLEGAVEQAATRALLNVVGTAIGASRTAGLDAVVAYALAVGGRGPVPVLGRAERLAPTMSALAAGVAAHYDDFDDTHLETVIHPGAACLGALLAVGVPEASSGSSALTAFALGVEGQLRVGAAMSPSHYDAGWHITGTCGVLGAALTAGILLGFEEERLEHAVGLAASQTVGVREGFGTMTKPYHPGRAAANGVLAARIAAAGGTGPRGVLEAEQGFVATLADDVDWRRVTDGIGSSWELFDNTFKPYPCGIVCHPAIYAATELSRRLPAATDIEQIIVRCHPLVPELTGNPDPRDGLEARFSTIHGVCAGLADGSVSLAQYDDARVTAEDLVRLRALTSLVVDPGIGRDAAVVEVRMTDGSVQREVVDHAPGSLARPLTVAELHAKIERLVEPVLPGATGPLASAVEGLAGEPDLTRLCSAATTAADPDPERSGRQPAPAAPPGGLA